MRRFGLASALIGWVLALGCTPPYSNVPLAPPLAYSKGEDQLRGGQYQAAALSFGAYLDSGQSTYRARALYQLAQAQYLSESYASALQSVTQLEDEYPDLRGKQTRALRGDIAYATGERLDAVLLWEEAFAPSGSSEREALTPRIHTAIEGLSESEVIELANLTTTPEIYNMAIDRLPSAALPGERDRLVASAVRRDDLAGAGVDSAAAEREMPAEDAAVDAADEAVVLAADEPLDAAIAAEIAAEDENAAGPRIACLLPLTGGDRAAGRIALEQLRRAFVGSSAHLVVRDSGSDPALAARLTGQLAEDPSVLALIGPIGATELARASAVAAAGGLPMLPLSGTPGVDDLPHQAQQAADTILESIDVAGDTTRERVRETLREKSAPAAPAASGATGTAPL